MCDNCKCEEVEDIKDEVSAITEEELIEMLGGKDKLTYLKDPIDFSEEVVSELISDKNINWSKGVYDATYYSGYWNTLLNMGIPEEIALELLLTEQQNRANKEIQEMNVQMNIEMSKNQLAIAEKNQL